MQNIHLSSLIHSFRAIRKFPADFFYLDWQGMGLGIYAQNLKDKISVTLPWQSSQSAIAIDPSLSVEPAQQHEGFLVELPWTYLAVLIQGLQSLSGPDLGIHIEGRKVLFSSDKAHFSVPVISIRSRTDAELASAPKESSPDYPVCSLPLSAFRDLLKKSLAHVDPRATDPRIRGVCFELSVHTPSTCAREGVWASLPISRVDLRLSATNGETLSVLETPVTWHCLKNLRAFRQVGHESLDWTSKSLSWLSKLVDNKASITLSFFEDFHGLRLSVDPINPEQNSAPGFAIDLPWETVPFVNYIYWLERSSESPQVTLPANSLLSACQIQHAIASDYLRLEDLGNRIGIFSGDATQEQIQPATAKEPYSLEEPDTYPTHQAWAVTEEVQRHSVLPASGQESATQTTTDQEHSGQKAAPRLLSTHALLQSLQQLKGSQLTVTLPDRSLLRIDKVQPKGRETHVISCKVLEPAIGQRELQEQEKPATAIAQAPENTRDFANAVLASRKQAVPIVPSD